MDGDKGRWKGFALPVPEKCSAGLCRAWFGRNTSNATTIHQIV